MSREVQFLVANLWMMTIYMVVAIGVHWLVTAALVATTATHVWTFIVGGENSSVTN